jgi:hypothetical protein
MTQWKNTGLVHTRSWVQSPALKRNYLKIKYINKKNQEIDK